MSKRLYGVKPRVRLIEEPERLYVVLDGRYYRPERQLATLLLAAITQYDLRVQDSLKTQKGGN